MTQDKTGGTSTSTGNEETGKPEDSKLQADLTDEELQAVVGGATKIGLNGTGVVYRR